MSSWAIDSLRSVVRDLDVFQDGRSIPLDLFDSFILSLELVHRDVIAQQTLDGHHVDNGACELIRQTIVTLAAMREMVQVVTDSSVTQVQQCVRVTAMGRPRFDINREQITFLLQNRFTFPQIADMLGVSVRTVRRRMSEISLSVSAHYADITDSDLDSVVADIQHTFPMCGNRQMQGHLLARV